jgi:hypothetical protein
MWKRSGSSWDGSFDVYDHPELPDLMADLRFIARPMRPAEPTIVVRLGAAMASRIDINGRHRFADGVRSSTHRQSCPDGHDTQEVTSELTESEFPRLSTAVRSIGALDYEPFFRAAAHLLNFEVSNVDWTPPPAEGAPW